MKKIFFLSLLTVSLVSNTSFAQVDKSFYKSPYENRNNGTFNQGTSLLSFGYGFPNQAVPSYGFGYGGHSRVGFGPVYAKFEHGFLRDEVGLGGQVAFTAGRVKHGTYRDDFSAFSIGLLGFYHFNKLIPVKNLDVYAGAGLSVWSRSYRMDDGSPYDYDYTATHVYPIVKVGARYYVKPAFGFFLEVGYDQMSSANLGVTFRF